MPSSFNKKFPINQADIKCKTQVFQKLLMRTSKIWNLLLGAYSRTSKYCLSLVISEKEE